MATQTPQSTLVPSNVPSNYRGVSQEAAPPDFGSPEREVEALRDGCGVFDRTFCDRLALSGKDRGRFLNGQVTCAVKDLAPGEGTYGFLTSLKGRIETELVVLATDDEFWLDLPPGTAEAVRERLAKYVIVDRVEFSVPDRAVLTLIGPECFAVAATVCGLDPEAFTPDSTSAWHHREASLAGRPVRLVREPAHSAASAGADGVSIWLSPDDVADVLRALSEAGAVRVGWRAFERLRVERGRPLCGVDFAVGFGGDDFAGDTFPQETGLDDSVSYTKGCYLGQEVIARIHYRGGVQRHLRCLVLSGPAEPGADLLLDGKSVGRLTSTALSLSGDQHLGLAVVHQRAEAGSELEVREGEKALATATF